jgi:hypothetical protein
LPRGVTDALNMPGQQQQHQQHQQHQQQQNGFSNTRQARQQLQSLADKNRSFSGALRQLQGLGDLLNLLESPQWGQCLCDLDSVSVIGALVAFVRNSDWQQLQQQRRAATQQQQWQRGEHAIQVGSSPDLMGRMHMRGAVCACCCWLLGVTVGFASRAHVGAWRCHLSHGSVENK